MTAHRHASEMALYANDAADTETPWERWEFLFNGSWRQLSGDPDWSYDGYRQKPKPLEFWAVVNQNGVVLNTQNNLTQAEETLLSYGQYVSRMRIIHMREVTE